ncbi:MAG: GNAT family N-acetyltransferase [Firmicutes bacterium]|nr:GNAT family N-acetyltransferase [Bacillota bacterium]
MKNVEIAFCNGNDKDYQAKLNVLLKEVFFDFKFWYDLNLWDDNYESYAIFNGDTIVSNICVYKTQVMFSGQTHLALSIGAVATKEGFRKQGLSRFLMEHLIAKYDGVPMYLYADDSALDFYPKFGFERVIEKLPVATCTIDNDHLSASKLPYDHPRIRDYVYHRVNISEELDCLNTACINLFHIHFGYLKDCLYEIPALKTMVIAEQEGTTLVLKGVFSLQHIGFADLLMHLPFSNVERVEFGFVPPWRDLQVVWEEAEGDPLFVRGVTCALGDVKFPELSRT